MERRQRPDAAIAKEKYERARHLTEQARVDADLARAKAEAEKSRLALQEAKDNIEMIREEATRTSNTGAN